MIRSRRLPLSLSRPLSCSLLLLPLFAIGLVSPAQATTITFNEGLVAPGTPLDGTTAYDPLGVRFENALATLVRTFENENRGAVVDGVHIERSREIGVGYGKVQFVTVSLSIVGSRKK